MPKTSTTPKNNPKDAPRDAIAIKDITRIWNSRRKPEPIAPKKGEEASREWLEDEAMRVSIDKRGLLQAIVVTPAGALICGSRRIRVWPRTKRGMAGEPIPCVRREMTKLEMMTANLDENDKREDLAVWERALAFADIRDEMKLQDKNKIRPTQEEVAQITGHSLSYVGNLLRLVDKLDPAVFRLWAESPDEKQVPYKRMLKVAAIPRKRQMAEWKAIIEPARGGKKKKGRMLTAKHLEKLEALPRPDTWPKSYWDGYRHALEVAAGRAAPLDKTEQRYEYEG